VELDENGIIAGDWPVRTVWMRSGRLAASAARNSRTNALVGAAVRNSATTIGAIRQRPARLYTGNLNPLKGVDGREKRFNQFNIGRHQMAILPGPLKPGIVRCGATF